MAKKRKRFVRYWAPLTALALIFGGAFALYFITKATAPLENDVEVKTDTELLYYIDAKYDGVDINNYQSSDSRRLEVFSGEISVSDKLPKDLAFEGFVTTANGKFGASQRDDTSIPCSGYVIDDTEDDPIDEGTWSADGNTYTYHGLHYDKPTHTVTFRGNKIKAGCQLTIGVVMHTPATVDDPETSEVEHRRDFYNTAKGAETGVSSVLSNTVHTFIADEEFVVAKKTVTYVYDGTIPQGAPALPASSQHPVGSTVNLLDAPEVLGYTFSGWQTNDALITDDTFTMPNQDVVLRGSFTKNDNDFKVRYVINGTVIPERYAVPLEHDYAEGAKVKVDSTASGSVFEGYTFSGWSTDDVTISEDGDFTMPNKDVTIEGSFTAPKYEVRYLFNGDSLPENSSALLPQTTQHAEGEAITVAAPVSAEGYIFSGWSKTDFTMPAEDVEIYGEWTKPTGLFAPQISIKLVEDREFLSGETVRFRVTVKNTAAYAIRDVSITEKLTGAKFTAPVTASAGTVNVRLASFDLNAQPSVQLAADTNNYQLIDDTNALIPNIPAGGEVTLPAEYTGTVTARTTLTNPVVMTAAAADNGGGYDLDTSRNYRAEEDFVLTVKGQEQEDNPPTPTPDPEPEPEPQPEPEPETTPAEKPSSPVTLDDVRAIIAVFVGSMTALFLVVRFGFKKKNKVVTGVFIGMLAFAGSGLITAHVMAEDGVLPVAGRYGAESQHISYDNGDPGAWKTQVSYKATAPHEYEVTAEVLSNPINSNGKRDIVLVLDSSRSMLDTMWHANFPTSKADALSNNVRNLTNNILSNSDNRVALISFDTDARIETGFTNNATLIETKMRERSIDRSTNYYRALLKTEELLQDYVPADDTKLIVLFLTDGVPVHDKGMELSVAQRLRARFPDMILNAIQFDVPGDVIPSLKAISDKQYIVSQTEALERTLFHATDIPYYYDHFDFDLRIDSRNYEIVEDSATVTKGTFSIGSRTDYGTEYQMAQWDLGDKFRPGENHTLKFRIRAVGNAATNYSSYNLYDYRSARSSLEGQEDENVYYWYYVSASNYKDIYYNANRYPGDCGVSDSTEYSEGLHHWGKAFVLETVPIERVELYCSGWSWKGWQLGTAGVSQPNDDYFVVPDNNNIYTINIKGTWGKFSLDKRMEGSSNEKITATLLPGSQFKSRVFAQTGATGSFATDRTITTIERAEHLSANVDTEDEQYILSTDDSKAKVYGWVDNNKLYVYTDADRIAFNEDASHMFQAWGALTSIGDAANWDFSNVTNAAYLMNDDTNLLTFDGMEKWDTGNVTTFEYAFDDNQKVTSLEPLAGWNTENLSEITNIFYDMYAVESLEPLLDWDTSSLSGSLNGAFSNLRAITNLHGLENWDASRLTDIGFSHDNNLSDISAISGWDVSSAEDITIAYTAVQDFDALSGWQTDSLETLYESFRANLQLTDISGISSWNTSNVTTFYRAFYDCRKLENIDGLGMGWDTSNVTNMRGVFSNTFMLTDVSELAGWDTSKVTDMSSIFEGSGIVSTAGLGFTSGQDESENCDNLAALQNGTDEQKRQYRLCTDWDVSEVTNLSSAFNNTAALNDLSGLKNWRPIKASNMASIFKGTTALRDVDGVSEWGNLNALTSLASAFESSGVQNLDGLTDWITPALTNVSSMMKRTANLDDISFLEAWSPADAGAYPDGNDPHLASRDNFNNVNTMASTFSGATALADISPLRNLNVEKVKDMSDTFNGTSSLTSGKAIENWNPAELTNTTQMFFGTHITSLGWSVAGKWNTPKLTNMSDMFEMSLITTAAGLEHLDVSHVTNMGGLFSQARDLADISAIAGWNVSSVTSMASFIYYNRALTNLDALSSWTPSALKNLSAAFEGTVLTSVEGLRGWAPYVTNVTNLKATFNKGDYTSQVTTFEPIDGWGPYLINWEPNPDNWLNGTFWGVDASIRPCWASGDITNCN